MVYDPDKPDEGGIQDQWGDYQFTETHQYVFSQQDYVSDRNYYVYIYLNDLPQYTVRRASSYCTIFAVPVLTNCRTSLEGYGSNLQSK